VLFPNGRLQMDGYFYKTDNGNPPKKHLSPQACAP